MKYAINGMDLPDAFGASSQGTTAGRLVFTSGLVATDPTDDERLIEGSVTDECERVIDIAEAILAEVECTLEDVAQTTLYICDFRDFEAIDEVYASRFPRPRPARSVVCVAGLPLGARVSLQCVACR